MSLVDPVVLGQGGQILELGTAVLRDLPRENVFVYVVLGNTSIEPHIPEYLRSNRFPYGECSVHAIILKKSNRST